MNDVKTTVGNRNPIIDAAKGYGILLVFLGHLVYYDSPLFRVIFNFHMPLFFMLSGMTFAPEKDADCKSILARLWGTIGIPFLFFSILGAVICAFTERLIQHSLMDWLRAGASFVHGDPYVGGSLWFLTCLAVVKFLFWAWSRRKYSWRGKIILLVAAFLSGTLFGNFVHPKILLGGPLMFFSLPMAFFFFATGYYSRGVLAKIRDARYVYLIILAVFLLFAEVALALQCPTPNMAIPAFPAPYTFLPASLCGIGAVLCLSGRSFAAIRFVGKYSLYYFLMERWVREAWFALSGWLMPGFFPRDGTGNPNLMQLTIVQGLVTVVVILAMVTCLLPILRFSLSAMRHGLFHQSTRNRQIIVFV